MTYNANIPQASDTISASQPPILTNFFELNTVFGIDHVKFDDATLVNRGRHLKVTFNDVLVADPGLLAPACSLYTKATGAGNQLFFQNALASIVQLTGLPATVWANGGTAGGLTNYTIDTPWGVRIYSGTTGSYSASARTVIFPVPYTTIYAAVSSANDGNPVAVSCWKSVTHLAIGTAQNVSVNWVAIGIL